MPPFCVLDGLPIPCRLNEQTESPVGQGEVVRMFSGRARSTRRGGQAGTWSLVTTPETAADARVIEALTANPGSVEAYGDLFGRDSSAPIDVYVRPGRVQPRKYADGERRAVSFEVEEAHPLDTVLRYAPGFGNLTHSRADASAVATYFDRYGAIRTVAPAGALRDGHWIDGGRHTLLELGRENRWIYSEQVDNAAWGKTGITVTANATTAPDGALTADKLVEDISTGRHGTMRGLGTTTDNTNQSVSYHAKAAERSWLYLHTTDKAGTTATSYVNLSTGETGSVAAAHTVFVRSLGPDWFRVELVFNVGSGATSPLAEAGIATGDRVASYTGDGSSGIYLWGGQNELNAGFATSYIKTEAAAVTRATETAYSTLPAAIAKPTALALYVRFIERGTKTFTSAGAGLANIGGETSNYFGFQISNTGRYQVRRHNGTASVASTQDTTPAIGDEVELVGILHDDGSVTCIQSINGGTPTAAGRSAALRFGSTWGADRFDLNARAGARVGAMAVRDAKVAYRGGRVPLQGTADTILRSMRYL